MKIALLACDHVAAPFVEAHGTYPDMFQRFLNIEMAVFNVCDGYFPEVKDYDAYLTTGSKHSVYDPLPWIEELKEFTSEVYTSGKKFVGICFGHQLIAQSLGGEVKKAKQGYLIGVHEFEIEYQTEWMKPSATGYQILMLCQDQITRLPVTSKVLASSPDCPYGMIAIDDHFVGIQGHPEFTREYNSAVFHSRVERIGEEKVKAASKSLDQPIDNQLLSGWLKHFLMAAQ